MSTTRKGRKQKTPRRWDEYARWPDHDLSDDEMDIEECFSEEKHMSGTKRQSRMVHDAFVLKNEMNADHCNEKDQGT